MVRRPAAKNNWRDRSIFGYDGHRRKAGVSKRNRQARNRRSRRRFRQRGADYSHDGPCPPHPQP